MHGPSRPVTDLGHYGGAGAAAPATDPKRTSRARTVTTGHRFPPPRRPSAAAPAPDRNMNPALINHHIRSPFHGGTATALVTTGGSVPAARAPEAGPLGTGLGADVQAGPTRPATIWADRATSGSPPPGCVDPPTRYTPGTGDRFAGRRNAERGPLDELP